MSKQTKPTGAVAIKLSETSNQTRWRVDGVRGRSYYASTYPTSNVVFIEAVDTRRQIGGHRIADEVRAAIAKATGEAT